MEVDIRIEAYQIGTRYPLLTVLLDRHKIHVTSVQRATGLALTSKKSLKMFWRRYDECVSSFSIKVMLMLLPILFP